MNHRLVRMYMCGHLILYLDFSFVADSNSHEWHSIFSRLHVGALPEHEIEVHIARRRTLKREEGNHGTLTLDIIIVVGYLCNILNLESIVIRGA